MNICFVEKKKKKGDKTLNLIFYFQPWCDATINQNSKKYSTEKNEMVRNLKGTVSSLKDMYEK